MAHLDLLDAEVATLATIGRNDMPQQTAVWFLYADGALRLSLSTAVRKMKSLTRRPRCSLLILDPADADGYLEVRGTVTIEPDDGGSFARRLGAKYGGADLSEYDGPGENRLVVTIQPTNVYAVDVRDGQM